WMRQYKETKRVFMEREHDRLMRRMRYFTTQVFEPSADHLRDEMSQVPGHTWEHFDSRFDLGSSAAFPDGVPAAVRDATFTKRQVTMDFDWLCTEMPCFHLDDDESEGYVSFSAWAPKHLGTGKIDERLKPQAPLPPKNLDRTYTTPEIAWAVSALHDADGGFEPFLSETHSLHTTEWWVSVAALKCRHQDTFDPSHHADDKWLTTLVPLWDRLATELGNAKPSDRAIRPKRSTNKGEGQAKLIAALTKHHQYANGGCLNLEAIGNNELARLADVDQATASAFFKQKFKSHGKYKAACADAGVLVTALKLLNDEFAPHLLFGSKPADEDDRNEE
ncbi:MAG: hypothetical protein H0T51_12435, partial [Pirellulales bacterium]|nr:hypothetical protein [Pirellulales bacterium]